ncbi:flagellar assembly protein FliW [Clostridium sediminicola]|uniref:flagellar assembly protein FliW n=1 Tax=Clostridium sediminicola TaxID=3114879 RepID=UPI0031F25E50
MLVKSRFLGELHIDESRIIIFEDGILGFEDIKEYCIVPIPLKENFFLLQSVKDKNISFVLINPWDTFKAYDINIEDNYLKSMDIKDTSQLAVYSIISFKKNDVTANLLAPVVINAETKKGTQIVLHSSKYKTKHSIYTTMHEEEC